MNKTTKTKALILSTLLPSLFVASTPDCFATHNDWNKIMRQGYDALKKDNYNEAIKNFESALDEAKKVQVEDHLLAKTYSEMARAYKEKRDLDKAEEYYRKALSIRKTELGKYSEATTCNMRDLAYCLWSQRKYEKVASVLKELLDYKEKAGDKQIDRPLKMLARIERDQHKYKEANQYLARLLTLKQKELGKNNRELAEIYEQIARNKREQGKYDEAVDNFNKSAAIIKKIQGDTNLDIASLYDDIGYIWMRQLKYSKAEPMFKRSLDIRRTLLEKDNTEVLRAIQRLANCYEHQNKVTEAKKLIEEELTTLESSLGKNHIDVSSALKRLARLHIRDKNYSSALKSASQALELRRAISSKKDSSLSSDVRWVADLYAKEGKYKESLAMLNEQESIVRKLLGKSSTEYVRLLKDQRNILNRMNRKDEAKKLDDKIKALEKS